MSNRLRILLCGESATLAHICRPYVLAHWLHNAGHEVHFAADHYFRFVYDSAPFVSHFLRSRAPAKFAQVLRQQGVLFTEELLSEYIADEKALIQQIKPDVVIGDLRPSLSVSCPVLCVPYVALTNAYWSPYAREGTEIPLPCSKLTGALRNSPKLARMAMKLQRPIFSRVLPNVLAQQAKGLDALRKRNGLSAFEDYFTGFTHGDVTLYADIPSLCPLRGAPSNHQFLGHVSWSPNEPLPFWWNALRTDRPLVFVSLGSSGEAELFPEIISALESLDVTVIIATAGKRIGIPLPKNCYAAEFLPGHVVAEAASLVITNGGSPGSYQALVTGTPVVGIAANMDQLLSMVGIERSGAGVLLRADLVTKKLVQDTVHAVLTDPSFRANAAALAHEFEQHRGAERLESILAMLPPTGVSPRRESANA